MYKMVTLSDGQPCRVRVLGLFELNGKGREVLGVYRYSLLLATGQITEDEYDLRALDEIPRPPDKPVEEIKTGSVDWYDLKEYETYLCAVTHEKHRIESYHDYVQDITAYILTNCLSPEDRNRIVTVEDWEAIYQIVFVPELTMEVIRQCLADTFQGFLSWAGDTRRNFRYLRRRGTDGGFGSLAT